MEQFKSIIDVNNKFHQQLAKLANPFLQAFGATQVCFDYTAYDGKYCALNTNPQLWEYYLQNQGFSFDPMITDPSYLTENSLFLWSSCEDPEYKNVLHGFKTYFSIGQGISFNQVLPERQGVIGISFGGSSENKSFIPKLLQEKNLLSRFMHYLYKELKSYTPLCEMNFYLPNYKKDKLEALNKLSYHLNFEQRKQLLVLMNDLKQFSEYLPESDSFSLLNLQAIDLLEQLGSTFPSEELISKTEFLISSIKELIDEDLTLLNHNNKCSFG